MAHQQATPGAGDSEAAALARNSQEYQSHWSSRFRRTWTYSSQGKLKRFRRLVRNSGLKRVEGLSVFDQGFGLGLMLFSFPTSCRVAGVELGEDAVRNGAAVAKSMGYRDVDLRVFVPGAGYPLEWRGSFDVVISSHVLEHTSAPREALGQLLDLLKPNGTALIVLPVNEKPGEDLNHFSVFTKASALSLIRSCQCAEQFVWECDRLWHLLSPLAYVLQRRSTLPLRVMSLIVNAVFSISPLWILNLLDRVLALLGYDNRQVFIACRRVTPAAPAA